MYQYDDVMVPKHIVTWNKVLVMLDMFNRTKHWVMWFSTDAVVTNHSVALEDIIKEHSPRTAANRSISLFAMTSAAWEVNTGRYLSVAKKFVVKSSVTEAMADGTPSSYARC